MKNPQIENQVKEYFNNRFNKRRLLSLPKKLLNKEIDYLKDIALNGIDEDFDKDYIPNQTDFDFLDKYYEIMGFLGYDYLEIDEDTFKILFDAIEENASDTFLELFDSTPQFFPEYVH